MVYCDVMCKESHSIILFEPYCWGIEHASFNAAFARTIALAYPDRRVIFCGEDEHVENVQTILTRREQNSSNLSCIKLRIYRRNAPKWQRWRNEFFLMSSIRRIAEDNGGKLLVLCSLTGFGLFALNMSMWFSSFSLSVIAVPHSILANLEVPSSIMPWNIGRALSMNFRHKVKFIALSESIYENVMRSSLVQQSYWAVLDLPYIFDMMIGKKSATMDSADKISLGFFGAANSGKGFDLFCRLADRIGPEYPNCEFTLIGFYYGWNTTISGSHYVKGVSGIPLSPDEFERRAIDITYSVWLANPEHYLLTASATFLDSLAYLKPGIYLRNAYVENYFDRMGDIGYLCDSYDDVAETVDSILRNFPKERYKQQVENILRGRHIFSPVFLAPKFRQICEGLDS